MSPASLQCFAVRSLGWLQVEEEDLSPGRSSLAVSNVIQQLSHCSSPEQRDRSEAWGEVRCEGCLQWQYARTAPVFIWVFL